MATIAYDGAGTGEAGLGGSGPAFAVGSGRMKFATGTFAFDSSYPTGGEDISAIFGLFKDGGGTDRCYAVIFDQPIQAGAQTGKFIRVDHTNKKVQLFTNASPFAEVANASDQSLLTGIRWIAWGKR